MGTICIVVVYRYHLSMIQFTYILVTTLLAHAPVFSGETNTDHAVVKFVPSTKGVAVTDRDDGGFKYLSETCKKFYYCWEELGSLGNEFAFLTLGQCNATGKNRFDPRFPETAEQCDMLLKLPYHNYAFAVPRMGLTWPSGAVRQMVTHLMAMRQWTDMVNIPDASDVYLFTYASPCRECTRQISNIKESTVHVSWINQYGGESASEFYQNLETLFKKSNVKVLWKTDNPCKTPRSYQYALHQCLTSKITEITDCSDVKGDIAKFINKLMYECIAFFSTHEMRKCKDTFIAKFASKADDKFKYHLMICMQNLYIKTLGPPLDPDDPTWGSQTVTDLKGEYPDFCFKN